MKVLWDFTYPTMQFLFQVIKMFFFYFVDYIDLLSFRFKMTSKNQDEVFFEEIPSDQEYEKLLIDPEIDDDEIFTPNIKRRLRVISSSDEFENNLEKIT